MFSEQTYRTARVEKIPVSVNHAIPDEMARVVMLLRGGPDEETAAELAAEGVQLTREDELWFLGPVTEQE